MKTGEKIRKLRLAKELTLSEIEARAGISEGNLSRIERGLQWVSEETLFGLARALGVSPAEFFPTTDEFDAGPALAGKIPMISWETAAANCGASHAFLSEDALGWTYCPFKHGRDSYVLKVSGNSMFDRNGEKSFRAGDFIAVDPAMEPTDKSLVVARTGKIGPAIFRQLLIEQDGERLLMALNPSWPDPIIKVSKSTTICGVVIGKWSQS